MPASIPSSLPDGVPASLKAVLGQRSLGFAIGCFVGLTLGLSWKHKPLFSPVLMKAIVVSSNKGIDVRIFWRGWFFIVIYYRYTFSECFNG